MISFQPLRDLLAERGISFRQLARECNITSNATVALNNDQPVRLEVLAEICAFLDVPIESILHITKPTAP